MDLKTCWGFVPILCGTEAISLFRAEEGASSVASSRQVVHTKGKPWAQLAEGSSAVSQQEPPSPNTARPLPPPEKSVKCEGGSCHNPALPICQQGLTPSP